MTSHKYCVANRQLIEVLKRFYATTHLFISIVKKHYHSNLIARDKYKLKRRLATSFFLDYL